MSQPENQGPPTEEIVGRQAPGDKPVTNSNKGFKTQFLLVRTKNRAMEAAKAKITFPTSWSPELKEYDSAIDPEVIIRKEATAKKATLKSCQKRKRQEMTRGGAGNSRALRTPKAEVSRTVTLLEQLTIKIPAASDFFAVLRVWQAAADIAEEIEGQPEVEWLVELLEKKEARYLKLEGDLQDREDKLACCKDLTILELQEENRIIRAEIKTLANAEADLERCREQIAEDRAEADKADEAERRLSDAELPEAEVLRRVKDLEAEVQTLEARMAKAEGQLKEAEVFDSTAAKPLLQCLNPG